MTNLTAYGSGYSTTFNGYSYVTNPSVILRFLSILFSIIVFGCMSSAGRDKAGVCILSDSNACNYGIAIGVIAFLICLIYLVFDGIFERISSAVTRRNIVTSDIALSGAWTFMWFVGFCYMTSRWVTTGDELLDKFGIPAWQRHSIRAALAFTFFSLMSFFLLTVFASRRIYLGAHEAFIPPASGSNFGPEGTPGTAYSVDPVMAEPRARRISPPSGLNANSSAVVGDYGATTEIYAEPYPTGNPAGEGPDSFYFQEQKY